MPCPSGGGGPAPSRAVVTIGLVTTATCWHKLNWNSENNGEQAAHILNAIKYAACNGNGMVNLNDIFSNLPKAGLGNSGAGGQFMELDVRVNIGGTVTEMTMVINLAYPRFTSKNWDRTGTGPNSPFRNQINYSFGRSNTDTFSTFRIYTNTIYSYPIEQRIDPDC